MVFNASVSSSVVLEVLVCGVIQQLRNWGAEPKAELDGWREGITFLMSKGLRMKVLSTSLKRAL